MSKKQTTQYRVALVHDAFMQWGGAENLVLALHEIWPEAPIYTAAADDNVLPDNFPRHLLKTSFLQQLPLRKKVYQPLFFLQPAAFESFNLNDYDLVLSSTTKFAKCLVTRPGTLHICYCNTPTRIVWFFNQYLQHKFHSKLKRRLASIFLTPIISRLLTHDYIAAQRADHFIANSQTVARRVTKFYNRSATVIYPFADLERFFRLEPQTGDYYLIVSRLSGHKRVGLAIEAFNQLGLPLKIIGTGEALERYRQMAKDNIELLGWLPNNEVERHYQNCRAFLYPQEEDFGITAVEAQAAGKPVIAYRKGGATETVIENQTGVFFDSQEPASLIEAVKKFRSLKFDPRRCRENAGRFSKERFQEEIKQLVENKLATLN